MDRRIFIHHERGRNARLRIYLNTGASFLPKGFQGFLHADELQFQVVHRWKKCG